MGVVHVVQVFCLAQLMSVVCEMRGVDGECEVCMCLVRVGVGGVVGEWMRGLVLGFPNPVGTGGVVDVCLCLGCGSVGGVGGECVGVWTRIWRGGVMSV